MPSRKYTRPRRTKRKAMRRRAPMRRAPRYTVNTASVKETYTTQIVDGAVVFVRNTQLADLIFDRAQAVAAAYQEYRIKYVKLTFKPAADTFPAVAGNSIPQLYWMVDKTNALPTNATADTFFSMGARPRRMDDKNLVYAYKPAALVANYTAANVVTASQLKISPWLSTNANSGAGAGVWAPSAVDHLGCAFYVTKINAADALQYSLDVEVVFDFRKPLWKGSDSPLSNNLILENGTTKPIQAPTLG